MLIKTSTISYVMIISHTYVEVSSFNSCAARFHEIWLTLPLPWANIHWLVQCTLECHWNATGWPSVHWHTTVRPSEYVHWNATGKTKLKQPHTGMPLEKLSWIRPTLGCHWRNSNFCSIHWNSTGGTVTAHIRPDTYSWACRVASMPVSNDKMAGHQ